MSFFISGDSCGQFAQIGSRNRLGKSHRIKFQVDGKIERKMPGKFIFLQKLMSVLRWKNLPRKNISVSNENLIFLKLTDAEQRGKSLQSSSFILHFQLSFNFCCMKLQSLMLINILAGFCSRSAKTFIHPRSA